MGIAIMRAKITKAVIFAGGQSTRLSPLTNYSPVCIFPVFNRPLIEHAVDFLASWDIKNIVIAASKDSGIPERIVQMKANNGLQVELEYVEDEKPRGTAGILRDLKGFLNDESFIAINCNTFMSEANLDDMLAFHHAKDSYVTIGVQRSERASTEGITASEDGLVNSFSIRHSSRERRSTSKTTGIYIFRPEALEFIDKKGYFDIKEQLIPAIRKASLPIYVFNLKGRYRVLESVNDYYGVHKDDLLNGYRPYAMSEVAEGIWIDEGVSISPQSYLVGPVIIGRDSVIEDDAQIIGPVTIGNGCRVGKGAMIRESVLWNDTTVGKKSGVLYSVVGPGVNIKAGSIYKNMVLVESLKPCDLNIAPSSGEPRKRVGAGNKARNTLNYKAFLVIKRLLDICFSLAALAVLSPLMLLIAVIIKFDSKGPIFFSQKRCGKDGKDFNMLKFRTMVQGADGLQQKYTSSIEGPMFKLPNDPRITRFGQFLRRSSLDELPQIINIVKGEMSLIGPRPLVMNEMRFSPSWRDIRLKIRPGLTGLWQIQGRSTTSFHDWIKYDVYYATNQSLWLDIKIFFKTISVVFKKIGAY